MLLHRSFLLIRCTVAEGIEFDHGNEEVGHPANASAVNYVGYGTSALAGDVEHMFWYGSGQDVPVSHERAIP